MTGAEFSNYGDGFEHMARGLLQLVNCALCRYSDGGKALIFDPGVRALVQSQIELLAEVHSQICKQVLNA